MRRRAMALLVPMVIGAGMAQEKDLFEAARRGDLEAVKALAAKADRKQRGPRGRTALHEAAAACRIEAARFLAQAGWDALARDDDGAAPLTHALKCPGMTWQMLEVFFSGGRLARPDRAREEQPAENRYQSLHGAVSRGQAEVVRMLLRLGVKADEAGPDGTRALDIACLKGDLEVARALLEGGADAKRRNRAGSTPLHDAALGGHAALIELLAKHGAEVNAAEPENSATPLHHAASFGRLEAVKALVRLGAAVTSRNADGRTARDLALRNGHEEAARFLSGIP